MQLENLTSFIGTEVKGLDLREPVSDDDFAVLRETLNQRSVLLFRGQRINESQHVAFSRRFGPLLGHVLTQFLKKEHPEVYVLSNVSENGKPIGNHKEGWNWHSDLSYKAEPSMGALLYALEVPPVEGDTFLASGDHSRFYDVNQDFHDALYEASNTHYLAEQTRALRKRVRVYRRYVTFQPGRMSATIGEHGAILDAIRRNDPGAAFNAAIDHVSLLEDDIVDLIAALSEQDAGVA